MHYIENDTSSEARRIRHSKPVAACKRIVLVSLVSDVGIYSYKHKYPYMLPKKCQTMLCRKNLQKDVDSHLCIW